jgi:hypothetical protein
VALSDPNASGRPSRLGARGRWAARKALRWLNGSPRAVEPVTRRVVGLIARHKVVPSYLIIGAQKAGTTSLGRYLDEHPQVMPSWKKEINYFNREFLRGDDWYRLNFPLRLRVLAREARVGPPVICGEATPDYLFHPDVAERVRALLPDVRIIVLLREPVSRAYSQYCFDQLPATGPFPAEIKAERSVSPSEYTTALFRLPQHVYRRTGLLARGRYAEQLERWLGCFSPKQILVVSSKRLSEATAETYGAVCTFLGLKIDARSEFPKWNRSSYEPLHPTLRAELRSYYAQPNQMLIEQLDHHRPSGAEIVLDEIRRSW